MVVCVVCVCALCVCVLCVCVLNNHIRGYIWLQTFNCVAPCKHTTHSREQAQKRGITDSDIRGPRLKGNCLSPSTSMAKRTRTKQRTLVRGETKEFEQLQVGEVIKNRRVQMVLHGEKMGPEIRTHR